MWMEFWLRVPFLTHKQFSSSHLRLPARAKAPTSSLQLRAPRCLLHLLQSHARPCPTPRTTSATRAISQSLPPRRLNLHACQPLSHSSNSTLTTTLDWFSFHPPRTLTSTATSDSALISCLFPQKTTDFS